MKKLFIVLPILFLFGCKETTQTIESVEKAPEEKTEEQTPPAPFENPITAEENFSYHITETSTIEDFKGKPSIIVFGGKFCPHCRNAVPVFKSEIWNNYKDKANLWVNVVDKKRFDIEGIAQGFNPALIYNDIAEKDCEFVPSWIVLDKDFNVIVEKCGGGEMQEMKESLDSLL